MLSETEPLLALSVHARLSTGSVENGPLQTSTSDAVRRERRLVTLTRHQPQAAGVSAAGDRLASFDVTQAMRRSLTEPSSDGGARESA